MDNPDTTDNSLLSWSLGTLRCPQFSICTGGYIPLCIDILLVGILGFMSVLFTARVGSLQLTTALLEISRAHGMSEQVSSSTIIAAATSLPVFMVTIITTFFVVSNAGVEIVIGTCIYNLLICIGLTGILYSGTLSRISIVSFIRDSVFYVLAVTLLLVFFSLTSKSYCTSP